MGLAEKVSFLQGDLTEMHVDAIVKTPPTIDLQLGGGVGGRYTPPGRRSDPEGVRRDRKHSNWRRGHHIGGKAPGPIRNSRGEHATWRRDHRTSATSPDGAFDADRRGEGKLRSIAFPAVGTGIAGFPFTECAQIMLHEVAEHLEGANIA